jgi:hypothetical protein
MIMAFKLDKNNFEQLSVGLNLAVGFCAFIILGYFIDRKLGTNFWIFIGIFLGLFYCGYEFWKLIRQANNKNKS